MFLQAKHLYATCNGLVSLDRGPPLPSIAQWISHLFANVDLSPTDLMEAIILAAAAQSMRRKMRIKRALRPAIARASQVKDTGSSSSDADSDGRLSRDS